MRTALTRYALLVLSAFFLSHNSANAVDMIIHNGPIYTAVDKEPMAEAVAVKDGQIAYVGPFIGALRLKTPDTHMLNLNGAALYPGFTDAHAHLDGIGMRELTLNLEGVASITELRQRVKTYLDNNESLEVIIGRGWIETHWPEGRFPTRQDLDAVVPDIPVFLGRSDGHAAVLNSRALALSGIGPETKAPFGGDILRDENGVPTGMLIDSAMGLAASIQAKEKTPDRKAVYEKANEVYTGYGWTGIHFMSAPAQDVALLESLSDEGHIALRVYNSINREGAKELFKDGPRQSANGHVITRAVKLYMDGALGSRGAALLAPYSDADSSGLLMMTKDETVPFLNWALSNGIQINTHAIGDRGNRIVLDWYEQTFKAVALNKRSVADPRWRIEHAQIITPQDLPRFKRLSVIPSMQPSHAIGDLHFAPHRLGKERLDGAYAWQSLIDSGSIVVAGSDAPVERGDPMIEFYAAVARMDLSGFSNEDWHRQEAVSRADALKMFTLWPAYASFQEQDLGSISVGKRADFSAFDADIMTIPLADIPKTRAVLTIIDGKTVYKADGY